MRTTRTWLTRIAVGLGALTLLLPGGAAAQDEAADPQQMCEEAGGEWSGETCFNVWCGWDDPPICEWMGFDGSGTDDPEPAPAASPSESLPRTQPVPATAGTPGYTG